MYERTYHAKVLQQDPEQPKARRFPWRKIIFIFCGLLIISAIITLIKVDRFQVNEVEVFGTKVADPFEVSQFVISSLQGNYLWVLPRSSIVLINPDRISDEIKAKFPRFKYVVVERQGMHGLRVDTEEYPGVYLWCDNNESCSFMDETGVVFSDAPYFSGSAYLKIYGGDRKPFPFQPISTQQVKDIANIKEKLSAINILPTEFHFDERKLTVIFFHNTHRVEIYFDTTDGSDESLETLYTGLQTEPMAGLYNDKKNILEYLDLRFSNKLVYKFKQ